MLLRFRVSNYRSIRDEQELSFVATDLNEGTARDVAVHPAGTVRIVPVAGVYGENASGKSNLLGALHHCAQLVTGLRRSSALGRGNPLRWEPFALDVNSANSPTPVRSHS